MKGHHPPTTKLLLITTVSFPRAGCSDNFWHTLYVSLYSRCTLSFLHYRRIHSPVPDSYLDSHHFIFGPIHQVLLFIQSHTSSHHVSYLQYSNKSTYALMDHGNVSLTHWGKIQILSTSNVPKFLLMIHTFDKTNIFATVCNNQATM